LAPEPVWTARLEEKSFAPAEDGTSNNKVHLEKEFVLTKSRGYNSRVRLKKPENAFL
jgi:hypothetical protein